MFLGSCAHVVAQSNLPGLQKGLHGRHIGILVALQAGTSLLEFIQRQGVFGRRSTLHPPCFVVSGKQAQRPQHSMCCATLGSQGGLSSCTCGNGKA